MKAVARANPTSGDDRKLVFGYDYMGRRVRKQVFTWDTGMSEWNTTPAEDLRFVYDGWNVVETLTPNPEPPHDLMVVQKYTWGLDLSGLGAVAPASLPANGMHGAGGIGGLLAVEDIAAGGGSSNSYWFFYDGNGNVGQVIRASDRGIAARYEYDPYGGTLVATGEYAAANPLRFSTKWCDGELGTGCELYYYGYRYYSPRLGRWLSRGPAGGRGGVEMCEPCSLRGERARWQRRACGPLGDAGRAEAFTNTRAGV
ncbi:MAG: RHS repeat-associated core domain-containing protein [Phycisphaerae bacterium]